MTSSSPIFVVLFIIITITTLSLPPASSITATESNPNPKPKRWPDQFHSILYMNVSGKLELSDLWYDWPNGRNLMILQYQLGRLLYDLEWNNGTSFYYTIDSDRQCSSAQFDVGIVTPNWFDGATYLGQRYVDGFLCNVWEKADFLTYYEDLLTKRPVLWVFFTGNEAHVMTFEVGATLEDAKWQVPYYCFDQETPTTSITKLDTQEAHLGGGLARDIVEQYMEDRAKTIDTTMHRSLFDFSSIRASL